MDTALVDIQHKNFMRARHLRNMLIAHVESRPVALNDYLVLRDYFMRHPELSAYLPEVVRQNSDLAQVWQFLKYQCAHSERRNYLVNAFTPLLDQLREGGSQENAHPASAAVAELSADYITRQWLKIERDCPTLRQSLEETEKLLHDSIHKLLIRLGGAADDERLPARLDAIRSCLDNLHAYPVDLHLEDALVQSRRQLLAFHKHKLVLGERPEPAKKALVSYAISQAITGLLQLLAIVQLSQQVTSEGSE